MKHTKLSVVRRLLAMALTMTMLCGLLMIGTLTAQAASWDGSTLDDSWFSAEEDVLYIATPAQFASLASVAASNGGLAGKTVVLKNDIDMGDSEAWTPMSTFKGTLDGAGYLVSGLKANGKKSLVMNTLEGTVMNLGIAGSITGGQQTSGFAFTIKAGALIVNCYSLVNVDTGTANHPEGFSDFNEGTILNCYYAGKMTGPNGAAYARDNRGRVAFTYCDNRNITASYTSGTLMSGVSMKSDEFAEKLNSKLEEVAEAAEIDLTKLKTWEYIDSYPALACDVASTAALKARLRKSLEAAVEYTADGYSKGSWDTFYKARDDAQTLNANADSATDKQLTDTRAALLKAIDDLVYIADFAAEVDSMAKYKESKYGEYKAWSAFATALEAAQKAVANDKVTNAEMNEAKNAVRKAFRTLRVEAKEIAPSIDAKNVYYCFFKDKVFTNLVYGEVATVTSTSLSVNVGNGLGAFPSGGMVVITFDKMTKPEIINLTLAEGTEFPPSFRVLYRDAANPTEPTEGYAGIAGFDDANSLTAKAFVNENVVTIHIENPAKCNAIMLQSTLANAASLSITEIDVCESALGFEDIIGAEPVDPGEEEPVEPGSLGDVNADGKINASDATRVLLASVGKVTLTEEQTAAADVTGDGNVNASDATQILLHTVGKKTIGK